MATSEKWTDKDGEKKESTEWHKISCFRKTAEIVGQYLKKGQQVCVLGKIKTRKWEDKEGITRWSTEIIANRVVFLGKKQGADQATLEKRPDQEPVVEDKIPF